MHDLGCLDCRTDTGAVVPRLAADGDTVVAVFPQRDSPVPFVAVIEDRRLPPRDQWVPLVHADTRLRGHQDLVLTPEHLLLVGTTLGVLEPAGRDRLALGIIPRAELP